jgi:hypothetical protein
MGLRLNEEADAMARAGFKGDARGEVGDRAAESHPLAVDATDIVDSTLS